MKLPTRWSFQRAELARKRNDALVRLRPYRKQQSLMAYEPIDEVLARPEVRILRALRWFDWVSMSDLLLALEVEEDEIERARYRKAIIREAAAGRVDVIGGRAGGQRYRLSEAGRTAVRTRVAA